MAHSGMGGTRRGAHSQRPLLKPSKNMADRVEANGLQKDGTDEGSIA